MELIDIVEERDAKIESFEKEKEEWEKQVVAMRKESAQMKRDFSEGFKSMAAFKASFDKLNTTAEKDDDVLHLRG